jgi:hypothetical protein
VFKPGDMVMVTAVVHSLGFGRAPGIGHIGEVTETCPALTHHLPGVERCPRTHCIFPHYPDGMIQCMPTAALKKIEGDPDAVDTPAEETASA